MRHKFTTIIELEVTVYAHVSPAVPARPCSDPDNPAYSDPGDPGESSVEAVFLPNLKSTEKPFVDITDCLDEQVLQDLADEAYEDAASAAEGE